MSDTERLAALLAEVAQVDTARPEGDHMTDLMKAEWLIVRGVALPAPEPAPPSEAAAKAAHDEFWRDRDVEEVRRRNMERREVSSLWLEVLRAAYAVDFGGSSLPVRAAPEGPWKEAYKVVVGAAHYAGASVPPLAPAEAPELELRLAAKRITDFVANEVMCPEHGYSGLAAPIVDKVESELRTAVRAALRIRGAGEADL